MTVEDAIGVLNTCTEGLGALVDPYETIDEGLVLFQTVSTDTRLAVRVIEKVALFGELLLVAKTAYTELTTTLRTKTESHFEVLGDIRQWLEEFKPQPVVVELQRYNQSLQTIDDKLSCLEDSFLRLENCNEALMKECRRYHRAKSTAGGVLMASGCMALALSAAALLVKYTILKTGQSLSPATSVFLRISPWNTALTGGVVTVLGAKDSRQSSSYTKLSLDLAAFSQDVHEQICSWRSFRTSIQRLRHALNDAIIGLNVGSGIRTLDDSVWKALQEWIPVQERSLSQLNPSANPTNNL